MIQSLVEPRPRGKILGIRPRWRSSRSLGVILNVKYHFAATVHVTMYFSHHGFTPLISLNRETFEEYICNLHFFHHRKRTFWCKKYQCLTSKMVDTRSPPALMVDRVLDWNSYRYKKFVVSFFMSNFGSILRH